MDRLNPAQVTRAAHIAAHPSTEFGKGDAMGVDAMDIGHSSMG